MEVEPDGIPCDEARGHHQILSRRFVLTDIMKKENGTCSEKSRLFHSRRKPFANNSIKLLGHQE